MTKTMEAIKKKAVPILKEAGVTRSALFGSVVRGEETKDSDVDILIEAPEDMGMFEFVALERRLSETIKKKVDLVTYRSLHPLIKDNILNERIPLYGQGS